MVKHIRRWNIWRKGCLNSKWHKLLVLLGLRQSPTMVWTLLPEERNTMNDMYRRALATGKSVAGTNEKFKDFV